MSTTTPDTQLQPANATGLYGHTRIVIQGVRGAFHEIAARQFFGDAIEVVPALSFPELFDLTARPEQSDAAVMAIENSIAGSIMGNYKLLMESDLVITGEVYLPIRQNMMALPGVPLEDIKEVHSHPMALAQCAEYFKQYPHIRLVESEDTAESAARIVREQSRNIAAIAGVLAAEIYGLEIIAPSIETVKENYTRFLALERRAEARPVENADKASVCFTLSHSPGSLAKTLTLLSTLGGNLTKIQSTPLLGRPWEYRFFADLTVPADLIQDITEALRNHTHEFQLLGIYQNQPFEL